SKKEKPAKAEKPSKKKKIDDDEDDVEIVDLWETVDEDEDIELDGPPKPSKGSKGGRKPKNASDDDEPIIENDILIEQLINSTKKLKKQGPKPPVQIRTFINPHASLTVPQSVESKKGAAKKEPKGKFELEYVIRTSAPILYEFLTSPSGLSEWFADNVNIHDGIFTFFWDGSEQKARLLGFKEDKFIRLQWLDKPEGSYFEFRIERDDLTGDVSLIVTDFADEGSDMQTSKLLWDSQVNKLSHVIGSY
ncbi:MAG: START-like domain-containing protein, partial [Bacteroidia bacterium]